MKKKESYLYTRGTNPTVEISENKLAELQHGESAKHFSLGMAAISASIDVSTAQGGQILFVNNIYGPANSLQIFSTFIIFKAYKGLDFGQASALGVIFMLIVLCM